YGTACASKRVISRDHPVAGATGSLSCSSRQYSAQSPSTMKGFAISYLSRLKTNAPQACSKARIRTQRIPNRIHFEIDHWAKAKVDGLVEPLEGFIFVAQTRLRGSEPVW